MGETPFKKFLEDAFYIPRFGWGVYYVWLRNLLFFRRNLMTTFAWIFIEPLLYLFAFGYGLGKFVNQVDGVSYSEFIAPAMMATSGMFVAYFEGTYSTYTKLSRLNNYQTIILSPVSPDEVVLGEILWVSSKAFISVLSVTIVLLLMGLVPVAGLIPTLTILLMMCWVFAAIGVCLASYAESYEWFTYVQSVFIMPMSLFCGTYFPMGQMPKVLKPILMVLPLSHVMMSIRTLLRGELNSNLFINVCYLLIVALALTNLAAARFRRRLVY
jgi:lipooligosaccharide transport system permease protein